MTDTSGYSFQYVGGCLGNMIENGASLAADPTAEIQPLDVVSVILRETLDGPFSELVNSLGDGGHAGIVKIFLGTRAAKDGEAVYVVGQLNPPCVSPIPASSIEAMHKVLVKSTPEEPGDCTALDLLHQFRGDGDSVAPINPGYVSSWPATSFEELTL